jgi:hypothetical protein
MTRLVHQSRIAVISYSHAILCWHSSSACIFVQEGDNHLLSAWHLDPCGAGAYNADACAKHLSFPAKVHPQLSEPDIIRESARLCQLPAESRLGIASAQAQAHKKRGRSDVAPLSRSVHANLQPNNTRVL